MTTMQTTSTYKLIAHLLTLIVSITAFSALAVAEPSHELFLPEPVASTSIWSTPRAKISPNLIPQATLMAHYASAPVVVELNGKEFAKLVHNQVKADLGVGIGLFNYVEFGLTIPFVIYQEGELFQIGAKTFNDRVSSFVISDLRATLKGRFFRFHGFGMGGEILALLPTSAQEFQANDSLRLRPGLILDYEFDFERPLIIAAYLGWQFQTKEITSYLQSGSNLNWSVGAEYEVVPRTLSLMTNLYGKWNSESETTGYDALSGEVMVGIRGFFGNTGLSSSVGVATAFAHGYGSSQYRVLLGVAYAPQPTPVAVDEEVVATDVVVESSSSVDVVDGKSPTYTLAPTPATSALAQNCRDLANCSPNPSPDRDHDTIPDSKDACPDEPEDLDNFEDDDGCPEPDNDGDGILDFDDECPLTQGIQELAGCPFVDTDKDSIPDDQDQCPHEPEDFDDFDDDDGCPDYDNDNDGVLDSEDQCPLQPETINGIDDDDGCPDKGKVAVRVNNDRIEILDRVYFDSGRATIKPRSFNLLNQVASVLKARRDITVLRVEGHTDNRGDEKMNLDLSQQRAAAVKEFLINAGIDPQRLNSRGYGESHPVDTNDTNSGRANNRRVEFHIIEREKE